MEARRVKGAEDFSLAGRGLGAWVLVGTLVATWIGTGSIFGNAEKTYEIGLPAFWIPVAGGLGILALIFLAGRIRRMEAVTIQDILEARFGPLVRVLATGALLGAYCIIVSYQFRAGAGIVHYLAPDLPEVWAIRLVALFVVLYTVLAGMLSVAYTDVANGVLMLIGVLVALPLLYGKVGGWQGFEAHLPATQADWFGYWTPLTLLGALLPPFLLILGDANMYQRFFSARSAGGARRAAMGMFVGVLAMEALIIALAALGAGLVRSGALEAPAKPGHILLHVAFHALPPFVGALLVATAVAVVVSTADSYLLAPATSLVRDIYQRFLRPGASERNLLRASRLAVLALGAVAYGLAFTSDRFFEVALFAYSIYGCAITPVLLAALFLPQATRLGATLALVLGAGVALVWQMLGTFRGEWGWAGSLCDLLTFGGFDAVAKLDPVLVAFPLSALALLTTARWGQRLPEPG
ncbi:MAG: sodium:solute symporter family protein [Planctomycetota bacterium]